jgi:hypothetical protein
LPARVDRDGGLQHAVQPANFVFEILKVALLPQKG